MKKIAIIVIPIILILAVLIFIFFGKESEKNDKIVSENQSTNSTQESKEKAELDSKAKNITAEELVKYPETKAEYFKTDFSREILNGVDGELTIREYTGTDSIVVIPREIDGKKVVSIENAAFGYDSEVTAVYIPDTMINICESAFDSKNLRLVVFAEGTKKIGTFAFVDLKKLETVKLPNSLEELGATVFAGCTSLKKIELPDKLTKLENSLFSETENITITLGDNIESIAPFTFKKAKNITVIAKEGTASYRAIESYNEEYGSRGDKDYPKINIQAK